MAEIFVLIIFILLLALSTILGVEYEKRNEIERQLKVADQRIAELTEQVAVLNDAAGGKDISEIVRELVAARSALKHAENIETRLEEARDLIQKFEDAAKSAGIEPKPEQVAEALREREKYREALADIGGKSGIEIVKENVALRTEKARLEGQLANSQKKLVSLGKGNEMPSCWAKPDGTVEYIYDVAITGNGMIVRETNLPHRTVDRSVLPTTAIVQNQDVPSRHFSKMTRPLYRWSVEKKCRFYVKVFDLTGATEKNLYKKRLKTVVGRFYRDFTIHKRF